MSKKRLEEIINIITTTESEEEYNLAVNAFILSHMNWTLERIKELESENRILRNVAESNKYVGEQYLEQNKRYREVIEEAREYANSPKMLTNPAGIEKILSKALEGRY